MAIEDYNMNRLTVLSALTLASASPWQATAQSESDHKLEEIIVTSSRVAMPLRQIGTSVSVISQQEIAQRGFSSLYDVLRSQPSIAVTNAGGAGKVTSLRVRGEEGYRTLVLLDGIDISDTSTPQVTPRMEYLLSSGIQRVEILRGPQGLMYGADAGGVVNISTTAPQEGLGGELSAEGGRYGAQQFAGNLAGGNSTVDFNLSAADFETDGFNARTTDTVLRDDDGYDNTTLHGRLGWNVSDDLRLSLVARDVSGNSEYDSCYTVDTFAPTDACKDEYEQQAWRAAADYQLGRFNHQVFYSDSDNDRDSYADGQFSAKFGGEIETAGYTGSFKGGDALRLVYGVDLETQTADGSYLNADRDQEGYYLEYQGGFSDQLYITAGARYDDNEDFGTHTSYRASGAYLIPLAGGELKLKATFGTGFRAPSLSEVATNLNPYTLPPAAGTELSEEESEGYDLGVSWTGESGLYLEAVYFDQSISDEIIYDPASYGYLQASGDTESNGVELIAQWQIIDSLALTGNYTYNDTQTFNGSKRPFRPEHLGNLGINWRPLSDRLVLGLNLRLSHDSQDVDGTPLDDYELVDFNASFLIAGGLEIYGRVENLLDEDYEEFPTYNTSGAAGYAGLRYSF
jgi:vitamin B12 transporter